MKQLIFFFITMWCDLTTHAQISGSRFLGLGIQGTAVSDSWCATGNPAGVKQGRPPEAGLAVAAADGEPQIRSSAAFVVLPTGHFVFGAAIVQRELARVYREQRTGLLCAGAVGKRLSFGTRLDVYRLTMPDYGRAVGWSIQTGMQLRVSERLMFGADINNPFSTAYDRTIRAEIPVQGTVGLSYRLNTDILLVAETSKIAGESLSSGAGLEYGLAGRFFLRGGLSGAPFSGHAGAGARFGDLDLGIAYRSVQTLGYQTQFSINYVF